MSSTLTTVPVQNASSRAVPVSSVRSDVTLKGLSKNFGERRVLENIDLSIEQGSFVAIVGRSGCGKSTLLRLIAGLERHSAGELTVNAKKIRLMFQDARLLPWKSVLSNVTLGMAPENRPDGAEALKSVGLEGREKDWPTRLSGGQRQRVALARALARRPEIMLLDEPLGALDALTRIEMHSLIERLWQEQGFTAILVTHDVQEAIALADRVILIDHGKITLDQRIDLPRPRVRGASAFAELEDIVLTKVLATEA